MSFTTYKTRSSNKNTVEKKWVTIDGQGKVVGRLASRIAYILRGKHKPCYTPQADCGDYVIVTNAEKVVFTGNKEEDKRYISYTGYAGGQRETSPKRIRARQPSRIIEKAVKGMLPKNKLGRVLFTNMKVYVGDTNPHAAQKPTTIE